MCGLCSTNPDERRDARYGLETMRDDLRNLSNRYRDLADGSLKPHSPDAKRMAELAERVMKQLIREYLV